MATMDIIKLNGGQPANFLDCGGGATAHAIEQAFQLITNDPKVTAIFVNIFGGIVRCDAIAKGLIATAEGMNLRIPIVARLQGTNMQEAQRLVSVYPTFSFLSPFCGSTTDPHLTQINESGLKIFSFEDLQDAAEKAVQFSKVVKMGMGSRCHPMRQFRLTNVFNSP